MSFVSCPFCGEYFHGFANKEEAEHPPVPECPLFGRILQIDQWNMRPPKKEPQAQVVTSEVEYLRSIVERLALKNVPLSYSTESIGTASIYPSNFSAPEKDDK